LVEAKAEWLGAKAPKEKMPKRVKEAESFMVKIKIEKVAWIIDSICVLVREGKNGKERGGLKKVSL
jgi:hypothetical protein